MSSILDISIKIEILGEAVDSPRDFKICPNTFCGTTAGLSASEMTDFACKNAGCS